MADGDTPQEALENIQIVAREWIETARELGRQIPEPKGRLMYA
jgi:predicted RNase H-like HicB family nuclease